MAKITREILINAPVEKVFEYHSNPMNGPECWPSMMEVKDLEEQPGGGWNYNWVYKMAGIRLEGSTENAEFVENERIVTKGSGGVESTFVYGYKPEGEGTRLTMEVEYVVPVPVLGKLAEAFILKVNEREADTVMGNLKDRLEA
jgi:uncharacterized membrane protein